MKWACRFRHAQSAGANMDKQWVLYILECGDGTLYTGITDDLNRRLSAHREGKGAKYTRGRGPLILRYTQPCADHSAALKLEYRIKQYTRQQKLTLIREQGICEAIK